MKLIIGPGNPEPKFNSTRHNLGFSVLDHLAEKHGGAWQEKTKLHGMVAQVTIASTSILLLKPTTFYNDSGQSVRAVRDFYKIDNENVLVIHDELALPFGTVRTRVGGSDAGNNGIKSINTHIGENYARVRMGVWNEIRERQEDSDFVLSKFNAKEKSQFPEIIDIVEKVVNDFAADIFHSTSYTP